MGAKFAEVFRYSSVPAPSGSASMRLWTVESAYTLGLHCRAVSTSNDWAGLKKVLEC